MSRAVRPAARRPMLAIIRRDLTVVLRSRAVLLPIIIVPLILFVVLPAALALGIRLGGEQVAELAPLLEVMPASIRQQLGNGPLEQQILVFVIEYQFASMFLIVPLLVAAVMAADSFAGEKERKTLEALLYTPTTDSELYIAKLVGPLVAAVLVAFAGYALYALSANLFAGADIGRPLAVTPLWLVMVLWVAPAVAAVGLGVLVIVSARVRGFQEAYQLGGLVVLPIVLLFVAQISGVLFLDAAAALLLGLLVWLAAGAVLWLGFRAFRRERLLLTT